MLLSQLIEGSGCQLPDTAKDPPVTGVTADSREVREGFVFVCLRGDRHDGHDYVDQALEAGAVAVLVERDVELAREGAILLRVPDGRIALAHCAANFHGNPERELTLVGVTGTNGKTTVSYLFEAIAGAAGLRCGVVGTVGIRFGEEVRASALTTPDPLTLSRTLREMVDADCKKAILEVSSHALEQERVAALDFFAAAFTNLSRDHLDYHPDMETYFEAKARLFKERLKPWRLSGEAGQPDPHGRGGAGPLAVINGDDPHGVRLAASLEGRGIRIWRFSLEDPGAELFAGKVEADASGIRATMQSPVGELRIDSPMVGRHNLQNLLCAAGLALGLGWPRESVERGLMTAKGAPGRLERIDGQSVTAFVDYAHTDDALQRACDALREVARGRLIVVFGCGGDRDRGKRPLMGKVAGGVASLAVVTSDNPRTEPPQAIIDEILPGLEASGKARITAEEARAGEEGYVVEADRRAAIELAVAAAREGDLILVAGKGHETWQLLGDQRIHFDDREELRRLLEKR